MAAATNSISQSITNSSGVTCTYWLIRRVVVDVSTTSLTVYLDGYLTLAGQQGGQKAADGYDVLISGAALAGVIAGGGALLNAAALWIVANSAAFAGGVVN